MLARTWTAIIDERCANEYETFAQNVSMPMFAAAEGCLGVVMTRHGRECQVLTLWRDAGDIASLERSSRYRETVRRILAESFFIEAGNSIVAKAHLGWLGDHKSRIMEEHVSVDSHSEILARYHAAMIAKSADQLAALYAVDATHEFPLVHGSAGALHGREAVRKRYSEAWKAAPIAVREVVNVRIHPLADPDCFMSEQDFVAVNTITGFEFRASFVLVIRIATGEIVSVRDYTDNLTIAKAMGRPNSIAEQIRT